jgi:hypothetical protein
MLWLEAGKRRDWAITSHSQSQADNGQMSNVPSGVGISKRLGDWVVWMGTAYHEKLHDGSSHRRLISVARRR